MTERCALRFPELTDAAVLLEAVTDARFPKDLPFAELTTIQQMRDAIIRRQERWQSGSGFNWCVEKRADGCLIGMVGLARSKMNAVWELSYLIHPAHWQLAYATEAAHEALRIAFEELGAHTVDAGAATWNLASQHVLEKLGFMFQEENPEGYQIRSRPIRTREYSLPQGRWRSLGGKRASSPV
jgi:[ribosomal protein S5]-alanine N-acetyltransferase